MQKNPVKPKIKDDWLETFTGRTLWIQNPDPKDIRITDIAHSLSMICRFNGHTGKFYSVAQHCLLVADLLKARGFTTAIQLWGLFHDASEAYLGDIIKPLKPMLTDYDALEENFLDKIGETFNLGERTEEVWNAVKWADLVSVHAEGLQLMRNHPWVDLDLVDDFNNYVGTDYVFKPMGPGEAKSAYIDRHIELIDLKL